MDVIDQSTFDDAGADLRELAPLLAEAAVTEVPDDLLPNVLAVASARRAPGTPITGADRAVSPADAFDATVRDLTDLLTSLSPQEWAAPTATEYGDVHALVAHLAGMEALAVSWLIDDEAAARPTDHVEATQPTIDALRMASADEVTQRWSQGARRFVELARASDAERPVVANNIPTTADGMIVLRIFELWTHTDDICRAIGRPLTRLDESRLSLMSTRLVDVLPFALALDGGPPATGTVRFVLTGPGGGCYDRSMTPGAPAGVPEARIVADVVDLCRVAARRLDPHDLAVDIEGDRALAERVLACAGAFAQD